ILAVSATRITVRRPVNASVTLDGIESGPMRISRTFPSSLTGGGVPGGGESGWCWGGVDTDQACPPATRYGSLGSELSGVNVQPIGGGPHDPSWLGVRQNSPSHISPSGHWLGAAAHLNEQSPMPG